MYIQFFRSSMKSSLINLPKAAETDVTSPKLVGNTNQINDSLDFGGYQPSSFTNNDVNSKPPPRRRETTMKPSKGDIIFGDDLDDLN